MSHLRRGTRALVTGDGVAAARLGHPVFSAALRRRRAKDDDLDVIIGCRRLLRHSRHYTGHGGEHQAKLPQTRSAGFHAAYSTSGAGWLPHGPTYWRPTATV